MSYAPLFLLGFGYWMASNKQLVSNDHLVPKDRMTDADITEHTIVNFFSGDFVSAPAWPLLILFVVLALNQILGSSIFKFLVRLWPDLEIGDVDLDENLDNYWASLDENDRDWT